MVMLAGWGPAGYSGIQEVTNKRRVAIFSMWNEEHHRVELVDRGEAVKIDNFGGKYIEVRPGLAECVVTVQARGPG